MDKLTQDAEKLIIEINDAISDMLNDDLDIEKIDDDIDLFFYDLDSYATDYEAIKNAFSYPNGKCPCKLSITLIFQRLALIDLFYGTNIVRMRQFGLDDLAKEIWSLCYVGNGNHSDKELANKLVAFTNKYTSSYIKANKNSNAPIEKAFIGHYGLTSFSNNQITHPEAPSILSKYFFFLMQQNMPNNIGFPIYDSIVCKYAPKIANKLGIKSYGCKSDIGIYTYMLYQIIKVLESKNPQLWNQRNTRRTKFALFDHFLWRVGKAKDKSYSLLLTRQEYVNYITKSILPQRIIQWQNINF